jgi:hypothetical protein
MEEGLKANMLQAAEKAQSPWIKAALYSNVSPEKSEEIITKLCGNPEATQDELRFAAAWAREAGRPEAAVAYLERARAHATPEEQASLDSSLMSLGLMTMMMTASNILETKR